MALMSESQLTRSNVAGAHAFAACEFVSAMCWIFLQAVLRRSRFSMSCRIWSLRISARAFGLQVAALTTQWWLLDYLDRRPAIPCPRLLDSHKKEILKGSLPRALDLLRQGERLVEISDDL